MSTDDARIPSDARAALEALARDLATRHPSVIDAIHLFGSIALGDARPGASDIDLVLVHHDDAGDRVMDALVDVLTTLPDRPLLDGIVLTADDLAAGPDGMTGPRAVLVDGSVTLEDGGSARNPVTWATLRQCGLTWIGAPIDPARLWHDPARLDAWTRENLVTYWRAWVVGMGRRPVAWAPVSPERHAAVAEALAWGVLGVTRLHATLATGRILSKAGAGAYALEHLPARWSPLVREALRIRDEGASGWASPDSPMEIVAELLAYVDMVIDSALALPEPMA